MPIYLLRAVPSSLDCSPPRTWDTDSLVVIGVGLAPRTLGSTELDYFDRVIFEFVLLPYFLLSFRKVDIVVFFLSLSKYKYN